MSEGEKKSVKVVFAGEHDVGKTTLIHRLLTGESVAYCTTTLGASHSGTLVCAGHPAIELLLWDTAGQERYACLNRAFFRGAALACVCFSLDNQASFSCVTHRWLDVLQQSADCRPIFVGTKLDLACSETVAQVRQSCEDEKFSPHIFTSAVSGQGIPELKTALAELAAEGIRSEQRPSTVVRLEDSRPSSGQKEKKWIRRC